MTAAITDLYPGTVERSIAEYQYSVRQARATQNLRLTDPRRRDPKPNGYYKRDGGAVLVCGGEHELAEGLDSLFFLRVKHNSDGVACGLPDHIDVYFVGDKNVDAPVRDFSYIFEYDDMREGVDMVLSPCNASFLDDYTIITYGVGTE